VCVCGTTSVDSAVASLSAAVQDAMEQTVSRGIINFYNEIPTLVFHFLRVLYYGKNVFTYA
jgi:hypothetical protein